MSPVPHPQPLALINSRVLGVILKFNLMIYIHKYEGGCLKKAHLANSHFKGFYKYISTWGRTGTS